MNSFVSNFSFIKNICIGEAKYIPTFGFKGLFLLFKYRCSPNMSSQFKRKKNMNTFGPAQIFGKFDAPMILYLFYKIVCTYFRDSTISNLFKTRGNVSSNRTKMPIRFHKRVCSIDHSASRADQMLEQMGTFSLQAYRPWGCRGFHGTPRF